MTVCIRIKSRRMEHFLNFVRTGTQCWAGGAQPTNTLMLRWIHVCRLCLPFLLLFLLFFIASAAGRRLITANCFQCKKFGAMSQRYRGRLPQDVDFLQGIVDVCINTVALQILKSPLRDLQSPSLLSSAAIAAEADKVVNAGPIQDEAFFIREFKYGFPLGDPWRYAGAPLGWSYRPRRRAVLWEHQLRIFDPGFHTQDEGSGVVVGILVESHHSKRAAFSWHPRCAVAARPQGDQRLFAPVCASDHWLSIYCIRTAILMNSFGKMCYLLFWRKTIILDFIE